MLSDFKNKMCSSKITVCLFHLYFFIIFFSLQYRARLFCLTSEVFSQIFFIETFLSVGLRKKSPPRFFVDLRRCRCFWPKRFSSKRSSKGSGSGSGLLRKGSNENAWFRTSTRSRIRGQDRVRGPTKLQNRFFSNLKFVF